MRCAGFLPLCAALLLGAAPVHGAVSVRSMLAAAPGAELFQGQVVAITFTISNTGDEEVKITFPVSCSGNCSASLLTMTPGTWANLVHVPMVNETPVQFASPSDSIRIPAGGAYTFRWWLQPLWRGPLALGAAATAVGQTSGAKAVASDSRNFTVITPDEALASRTPGRGSIEVRRNFVRLEHRGKALVVVHGPPGGGVSLRLYGPSGVAYEREIARLVLDSRGYGTALFDAFRDGDGFALGSGVYWIVATGDVSDRKPVVLISSSERKGSRSAY